jgi:hypothetical protein
MRCRCLFSINSYIFGQFQSELVPAATQTNSADSQYRYSKTIPTQLSLLIFAFIYQLLLVYDALSNQNTIQVIGLVIMNLGIVIYTGIQKDQVHTAFQQLASAHFLPETYWSEVEGALIALPCIVALFTVLLAFLAWKLYQEFGWKIYKQIGADIRMKRRFLVYHVRRNIFCLSCSLLNSLPDLYRPLEVRLFLVHWFRGPVFSYRRRNSILRKGIDNCGSSDPYYPPYRGRL